MFISVLRQLRGHLTHLDTFLPRIPHSLNSYLDQITTLESSTQSQFALPVHYAFPRLGGAVVAELARAKEKEWTKGDETETEESDAVSTEDEDSDDESDDPAGTRQSSATPKVTTHRQHPDGSRSRSRTRISHSRRVTDPIHRQAAFMRSRAQTIGAGVPPRRSVPGPERRRDPLEGLGKALGELESAEKLAGDDIARLERTQERVGRDIGEVVKGVDEVQKSVDEGHFQKVRCSSLEYALDDADTFRCDQLRMLEDHYYRLRSSVTRPSTSVDFFWATLSYFLTVLFWLSWLTVTIFRLVRTIISIPVVILRWLFFIR